MTTNGSAAWADPVHPVPRHVRAPDRRLLEHRCCRNEAYAAARPRLAEVPVMDEQEMCAGTRSVDARHCLRREAAPQPLLLLVVQPKRLQPALCQIRAAVRSGGAEAAGRRVGRGVPMSIDLHLRWTRARALPAGIRAALAGDAGGLPRGALGLRRRCRVGLVPAEPSCEASSLGQEAAVGDVVCPGRPRHLRDGARRRRPRLMHIRWHRIGGHSILDDRRPAAASFRRRVGGFGPRGLSSGS
jgi:hypothetical protein